MSPPYLRERFLDTPFVNKVRLRHLVLRVCSFVLCAANRLPAVNLVGYKASPGWLCIYKRGSLEKA